MCFIFEDDKGNSRLGTPMSFSDRACSAANVFVSRGKTSDQHPLLLILGRRQRQLLQGV